MNAYPSTLRDLIARLSRLPGLGEKSATRIAMHLLRASKENALALAEAIREMKERIHTCPRCFHFTDGELCGICSDPARATGELCVVETTGDLLAVEQAGAYQGQYHVLQGTLAPLDGVGPEDVRIAELLERIDNEEISEIILATNPTNEGEATSHYIAKLLQGRPVRVSRIAYGIPMGGDLKYADRYTLEQSFKGRRNASE